MAKKSKEIKEDLNIEVTTEIEQVNPLTISECCKAEYISSGTKVYCSKCKAAYTVFTNMQKTSIVVVYFSPSRISKN